MLAGSHAAFERLREACEELSAYAVHFRYPGLRATEEDAVEAVGLASAIRDAIRAELGLVEPA